MRKSKNSHLLGHGCRSSRSAWSYCREVDLGRLIALWPREIEDGSVAGCRAIVAKLRQGLRAERRRGASGHWSYDLTRHLGLKRAYCEERLRLERKLVEREKWRQKNSPHQKARAIRS